MSALSQSVTPSHSDKISLVLWLQDLTIRGSFTHTFHLTFRVLQTTSYSTILQAVFTLVPQIEKFTTLKSLSSTVFEKGFHSSKGSS